jgi:RNA polymerase sigma factor (TIGR02999 family)
MPGEVEFSAVYEELRRIAAAHLARGVPQASLQATVLVHEAWLRLNDRTWKSKTHFLALASRAMRMVLIDAIRARAAQKRPSSGERMEWGPEVAFAAPELKCPVEMLLDLNRALEELEEKDARKAKVVEMRFFGGLEFMEIAEGLEVSLITVKRDWEFARAWLYSRLGRSGLRSSDKP